MRALNRALLARQILLERQPVSALAVVEHLVGLQAQQARPPFVGLWSRIAGFQREELRGLIDQRQVVKATLMRCTLHLMSRRDYLAFRPALQPGMTRAVQSILGDRLRNIDQGDLLAQARLHFAGGPSDFSRLRGALLRAFPGGDERALGYAVRTHLPLVVTPTRHDWAYSTDGQFALADEWLGEPVPAEAAPHALVRRYLAAFGPASAADVQAWSGLSGLGSVLKELQPELKVFRDEQGRALFDLPEAPRPPEDTPAPARLIADFDNLVLSHADRRRVISDEHRKIVVTKNGLVLPTILVDGFVAGTWKLTTARKSAAVTITPFHTLTRRVQRELEQEAESLLQFAAPETAAHEVRYEA